MTPEQAVFQTCVHELVEQAATVGGGKVYASLIRVTERVDGVRRAFIYVGIDYPTRGGSTETKNALVACDVDEEGRVTLLDHRNK